MKMLNRKGIIWSQLYGWMLAMAVVVVVLFVIYKSSGKLDLSILKGLGG